VQEGRREKQHHNTKHILLFGEHFIHSADLVLRRNCQSNHGGSITGSVLMLLLLLLLLSLSYDDESDNVLVCGLGLHENEGVECLVETMNETVNVNKHLHLVT
jgi:hypothetical protein